MSTCQVCEIHAESTFKIEGMDCHEEVAMLEKRLGRLRGMEAFDADILGQRLKIKYDAAKLSASTIAEAVAQTGMRAWLEHEQPVGTAPSAATRRVLVVTSGIFVAAGMALELAHVDRRAAVGAYLIAIAFGGFYSVRRALHAARSLALDINVLMLVAVGGAMVLGQWSEGACVVFLFALAQLLEARAMERARGAIRALMDLTPAEALVKTGGEFRLTPVDAIRIGDVVAVKPGEKIPLDGRVVAGDSHVNQAPVTGESLPVEKRAGDEVFAGTINGRGGLDVEVERLRGDSTLARIIELVERAQSQRAPSQAFVERFARVYTPTVLILALVVGILPPALTGAAWSVWIYRALVLLVISCPCALVISTPVSIVSALAAGARKGVLIKGGARLERLAAVRCVAFDKTGTLTRGELHVVGVTPVNGASAERILQIAASLEVRSEHPIGAAIVAQARRQGVAFTPAERFQSLPGLGAEGTIDGGRVILGSHRLFDERGLCSSDVHVRLEAFPSDGSTVVIVGDEAPIGIIGVADRPRESARDAVQMLRDHGVQHVALLTGDHDAPARALAESVGVDEVRAGLLPADKVDAVRSLRARYGTLAMVGDGINDAPALAAADVGIAMGAAGTDAALETADVALMADELLKIPYAVRLSRATVRNIRANIAFSLVLKAAFLVLAVMGIATLWMAVVADMGASLIVIANALRLLRE
ncbi:MAG TPA: heavy metal translocating P-type ATPase [Vicinamibacterales bacterium]|nr:heavy metal translocating P-type ATPase [Vicinamibacterales bacterium]